ncbi:MAG: sulfatase-like hydrolase/transferase, partial [Acidobacteriota bacterium]
LLAEQHETPFFLGIGMYAPHLPWFAPMEFFEPFPPDQVSLPPTKPGDIMDVPKRGKWLGFGLRFHKPIVDSGQWPFAVSAYLSCIHFLDAMLGRMFDALANGPNADNTVVVLWSDHGFLLGEKYHWTKFVLWERATRVPLLIHDPRLRHQGAECRRTVSLVDVYPTVLDLCGLPAEEEATGVSLVPLLEDPDREWPRPALTSVSAVTHAVRTERWRYIRYADGSEELYDHDTDPHEWDNLADLEGMEEIKRELAQSIPSLDEVGEGPRSRRWRQNSGP